MQTAEAIAPTPANGTDEVLMEKVGDHIALVTLNRPDVCNAVNVEMSRKMLRIVWLIEHDPEIRVAVLTGTGNSFSAGADLTELCEGQGRNIADGPAGFGGFVLAARSKPWIAAVHGHALGGGTEMVLACEMAVAGQNSTFGLPEVKRCLVPGAGGAFRLPRSIPRVFANQMVLTGEPISAQKAEQFGLINMIVDDDKVLDEALKLARSIASNAPLAVQEAMKLLRMAEDHGDDELARNTIRSIGRLMHTEDFREGPRAFLERRDAVWKGR
ncbi:MAG: enoyl-CoA hydratase-related protein [Pseudomonadota bacterium]|nr:enoyl-CoA hydratase-related protein [Pseudomonadota bacterium]